MTQNKHTGFGIARRLYALSLAVSLAMIALAAYAFVSLQDAGTKAERTETVRVPQLAAMSTLELAVTRASLQLRHAMLARTPAERDASLSDIRLKRQLIADTMAAYEKGLYTEKGKAQFAQLPPLMAEFWVIADKNVTQIMAGQREQAFAYLVDETIPARNKVLKVLDEGVKYQQESLTTDIQSIQDTVGNTSYAIAGLAVVIAVLLLGFSAWTASQLRRRVAIAQTTAERVRDGDLSSQVADDGQDEFSPLLRALSDMQDSLSRVVANVRSSAESVATASTQIAQGNEDLSGRTEQQASALEETNSTTTALGDSAQLNAANAREASQLALSASGVAQQGGEVVGQVVSTMREIQHSSQKIADIIGVIDGIAFQTNILALNAAVEAARAGEQGRGFAVVASEVRSLAQRSAEAAKEIKQLINASVERVEQGTALVDQAGNTMQDVVQSIQRVTDIVGEISSASQEQSSGVTRVSEAVHQMDLATQQNAALVEESAAAAAGLKQQAEQMVQAVSVFKLSR
ncbi:methyl-accepting chemotaxis protein [Hydrogenophaga sp.]|uniref:methyl-accepting chemotaxis protein n=1 Tax=Hydrogenophaga sp. TaxID=1904254 RepID=UPI0035B0E66F